MTLLTPVEDYSRDTLSGLVRRLQSSKSWEELLYREVELDEIWRLIDGDRRVEIQRDEQGERAKALEELQSAVHEVHDLVAEADDGTIAARRLTEIVLAAGQWLERDVEEGR